MDTTTYYNRLKKYYQSSFDFMEPFSYQEQEYKALASFHSHVDKYVLVKKAQVWAADSHEYCLFQSYDKFFCPDDFNELTHVLEDYMEPQLVRKGDADPPKDHMYTYLTIVILCQNEVPMDLVKRIRRYKYVKYYKMYTRGYSEAHIILADLTRKKVYTNRAGHELKKLYKRVFKDLANHKQ